MSEEYVSLYRGLALLLLLLLHWLRLLVLLLLLLLYSRRVARRTGYILGGLVANLCSIVCVLRIVCVCVDLENRKTTSNCSNKKNKK